MVADLEMPQKSLDFLVNSHSNTFWGKFKSRINESIAKPLANSINKSKKYALSAAGGLLLSSLFSYTVSAQQAKLNVNLSRQDGLPATGIAAITGDTTINDNAFLSPKTYILKTLTAIDDPTLDNQNIKAGENPTYDGNINVIFENYTNLDGKLTAYDITGRKHAEIDLSRENQLHINNAPNQILLQYVNENEKETIKIINLAKEFTANILQEQTRIVGHKSEKEAVQLKSTLLNNYIFSFTDPLQNIENITRSFTVTPGNTHTITESVDWTSKTISYSSHTNTNTTIKMTKTSNGTTLDERTAANGIFPTKAVSDRFNNETGIQVKYELTAPYTDPAIFILTQLKNQEQILDTLRNGLYYLTIAGNGETATIKSNNQTIITLPVGQEAFFKKQGDQVPLEIIVSKAGYTSKTTNINMNKGLLTQTINLDPAAYNHALNISALSSIAGKTILNATQIGIIKDFTTTPGDTVWVSTTSGAASYSWSDNKQTLTTKIVGKNIPGHQPNTLTFTMDDQETRSITFTGIIYSLTHPVLVRNQYSENVASASITGGDAPVTTGTNGIATITRNNLPSDANNLPLANYTTNLTITKSNIQTLNTTITSVVGTNAQALKNVVQQYIYWLYGNSTTPSGTAVAGVKDGSTIYTATVSGTNFETNHVTGITKTQTLNQVIFSATGYTSQTFTNVVINEGANKLEATLALAQYSHSLNISALSSILGKTIKDNTPIYIIRDFATTPGDTVWVSTTSGAASYSWSDNKQTLTTKIGSKAIPGHTPNSITFTMDDQETRSITFTGLIYSLTHPVLVRNQYSENVSSATITGGDTPVTTNTSGIATITRNNLPSDANNLPLANYITNLTITKNNIQTLNTTITSIAGTNAQTLKNIIQEYEHWLYGTSTTPSGTNVRGWKDGTAVHSGTVSGTNYETNHIKRTTKTFTLDSLTFTMTGYVSQRILNQVLTEGGNNVEATLTQTPQATVHNFLIKPKTINGDDITNLTLDFKWADGTTTHYSVQGDGFIHVNRTEYSNPTTTALVTHVTDTATYALWQFFRKPPELHNLADTNYAQNTKYITEELPRAETPLKVENIPNILYLYLGPTRVPTPETLVSTYGPQIRMDHPVVRGMMQRSPPAATAKFTPRTGAENVYVFQMTFNEYTGAPIDQTNLDRAKAELDKILTIYTLNDGTKLLNYEFYRINSYTDPKWLESQARDNHDNMAYTTFDQSSPVNGIALTTTYSINNKARIKNSNSRYSIMNTNGQICEEIYQQFNNSSDPPENTAPWVYSTTDITILGKTVAREIYFMNNGTTTKIQ